MVLASVVNLLVNEDELHLQFKMGILSIEKSKQPQRYFFLKANFDVVGGNEGILKSYDLLFVFVFSANFENGCLVNFKITFFSVFYQVFVSKLIGEKRFSHVTDLYIMGCDGIK